MENTEFKKGQIVYVKNKGDRDYFPAHFVRLGNEGSFRSHDFYTMAMDGKEMYDTELCLSVEDYHKMLSQPKDKDLVWAWDRNDPFTCFREAFFYDDKHKSVFKINGNRGGLRYDNYEAIPRDQWPEWAVEAYELLED